MISVSDCCPKSGRCWIFFWGYSQCVSLTVLPTVHVFCCVTASANVCVCVCVRVSQSRVVVAPTQQCGCTNVACVVVIVMFFPQAEDQMEGRDPHSSPEELMTLKNFRQV